MRVYLRIVLAGATIAISPLFGGSAIGADVDARSVAARIGRILGASSECAFIAAARVRTAIDKTKSQLGAYATDRPDVPAAYDKGFAEGRDDVAAKQSRCALVENELTDLEHQSGPWLPEAVKPAVVAAQPPADAAPPR